MESLAAIVGDRIQERRQAAGITQAELARRAGVGRETVSNYERGKMPTLAKIDEALNVPITDLIPAPDHDGNAFSSPPGADGPGKIGPAAAACLDMLARSRALEDPVFRQIIGLLVEFMSEPKTAESEQEE